MTSPRTSMLCAVVALLLSACADGGATAARAPTPTPVPTPVPTSAAAVTASPRAVASPTTEPPSSDPLSPLAAALAATSCDVGPLDDLPGLDADVDRGFYTQGCVVLGHVLLAPAVVDPEALVEAGVIVHAMLEGRADLAEVMALAGARTTIVGRDMGVTEVPEYTDLRDDPEMDWDARSRGFGGQPATEWWPASPGSAGEEDVLCLPEDRYAFESIMVHEFAHTVWDAGVVVQDPTMADRLYALYEQALRDGTWDDTYALETDAEYWAEGVQSYFDSNDTAEPPNGIHGHIDTNAELLEADPDLHALVGEVFADATWRWSCP